MIPVKKLPWISPASIWAKTPKKGYFEIIAVVQKGDDSFTVKIAGEGVTAHITEPSEKAQEFQEHLFDRLLILSTFHGKEWSES